VTRVVLDARDPADHLGHALERPELGRVAIGPSALEERLLHSTQLGRRQLGRAPGARRLLEGRQPSLAPARVPAADALPTDLQEPCDVCLGVPLLEQLCGTPAAGFLDASIGLTWPLPQDYWNRAGTRAGAHAPIIPGISDIVTPLGETL